MKFLLHKIYFSTGLSFKSLFDYVAVALQLVVQLLLLYHVVFFTVHAGQPVSQRGLAKKQVLHE